MAKETKSAVSTEPYKGVRDFYPEDMAVQNYIFGIWREVVERYGYSEYNASILEPAELYRAKSGEEIVNEQTYTFTDRGEREVTLRPEMTPTVARMVAAKRRELSFPLRWYSIPNLFRYERPQRGRLREHWQLNVDMFGLQSMEADAEIITIAYRLLKKFGLSDEQFGIHVGSRLLLNSVFKQLGLKAEQQHDVSKLIDRQTKIPGDEFTRSLESIVGDMEKAKILQDYLDARTLDQVPAVLQDSHGVQKLRDVLATVFRNGPTNAIFDPSIVRGFDYYTGTVFEVFDASPENNRSLFGGGRYDDLLDIFGQEKVPAVGFGMGDVTIRDVLETYNLIPEHVRASKTQASICTLAPEFADHATTLAERLRTEGVRVAVDYTYKKVGDQIKKADRDGVPFVLFIGEEEVKTQQYKIKNLKSGDEKTASESELLELLKR